MQQRIGDHDDRPFSMIITIIPPLLRAQEMAKNVRACAKTVSTPQVCGGTFTQEEMCTAGSTCFEVGAAIFSRPRGFQRDTCHRGLKFGFWCRCRRTAARELFGQPVPPGPLPLKALRNADFKEVSLEGAVSQKMAQLLLCS